MKRRLLIILLLIPVMVLGLGLLAGGWLLKSDAGSRWLLNRLIDGQDGNLNIQLVEGNLDDGLKLTNIRLVQDDLKLEISNLQTVADISLLPLQLEIESLSAQEFIIRQKHVQPGSQDKLSDWEDLLTSLRSPIAINISGIFVRNLELRNADNEIQMQIDNVSMAGRWNDRIEISQCDLETGGLQVDLKGQIDLSPPFHHQLGAAGYMTDDRPPRTLDAKVPDFRLAIEGDSKSTRLQLAGRSPEFNISGQVSNLFGQALAKLDVNVGQLSWAGEGAAPGIRLVGISGKFEGLPANYQVTLQAKLEVDDVPELEVELAGQGNLDELRISNLAAEADFLQASAVGAIALAEPYPFELDLEVGRLEPGLWISDWPTGHPIHGHASLRSLGSAIAVQALDVKVTNTDMALTAEGLLDPLTGVIDASLAWQGLSWPLGTGPYQFASENGRLQLGGSKSDWRFEGDLEFDTHGYPGGDFELRGDGGNSSGEISILKGEALGGNIAGLFRLDWQNAFKWGAELDLEQVNLGDLFTDWPVRLDAKLHITQDTETELLKLWFDQLRGEFEGHSVSGGGGLVLEASNIRFDGVRLRSGDSEILLDGDLADPAGLEFVLDVNKPGWMADYLGGEISGRGRIAPTARQPLFDIELLAHDLHWGEAHIEKIEIASTDAMENSVPGLNISAENFELGGFGLNSIQAIIAGDRDVQKIDIHLEDAGYVLDARLDGAVSNWDSLADSDWSGSLAGFSLASGQQTLVSLRDASRLDISASKISLGNSCFDVSDSGGLCLESSWQPNGSLDVIVGLSALKLEASKLLYEHQLEFSHTLDGEFRWLKKPGEHPTGRAAISISPGQFGNEQDRVNTAEGFFGFEMSNGNLNSGKLDVPFPGIGKIDVDYDVSGLALDGTGRIDALVKIDLDDISVLADLLPGLDQVSGKLNTDLQVVGVTGDPQLDGFVSLHDAAADIPYLGAQLSQVQLEGSFSSDDRATMKGSFNAGDGHAEIFLEAGFSDWMAPSVEWSLKGSSLRLLNTPALRLNADTDIRFGWEKGKWVVDGDAVVQQARFAPVTSFVNQVNESEDVRLVAGTLPYRGVNKPADPLSLSGDLEITLGDKVEIDTEVAELGLTGAVTLSWRGGTVPVANGRIHANGTLSVFGPQLHVRNGQVRFPNAPVNNPNLDIKAERDVFGNTQIRTAGVSITGSARRPVIEAYTNPYTSNDRAWALLITGTDVDYGQGVGAFEVGAYIAPRLYLSYGVSLFDDDNVVSARYDLKKGFGVKASSSHRESGIDMSYTIDR